MFLIDRKGWKIIIESRWAVEFMQCNHFDYQITQLLLLLSSALTLPPAVLFEACPNHGSSRLSCSAVDQLLITKAGAKKCRAPAAVNLPLHTLSTHRV